MSTFISILTAFGIGTLVAARVTWRVAIASHRQAWINALRDDIATFYKCLQMMHHAIGDEIKGADDLGELEKARREARADLLFVYERIVLRLNIYEDLHQELHSALDGHLRDFASRVPDADKMKKTTALARRVLKREWAVTKWGCLAPWITRLKRQEY